MTPPKANLYDRMILAIPALARLQDWVIAHANKPSATRWLLGLSFAESIIFPVPIDPLLAAIVLSKPEHYIRLAVLTAITSVGGGIVGWGIGVSIGEAITQSGWLGEQGTYDTVVTAFVNHGWLVVLIGAFTPFPYKITVISAGFLGIGIVPLIVASLIGRMARFLLVAGIIRHRRDTIKAGSLLLVLLAMLVFFWSYI